MKKWNFKRATVTILTRQDRSFHIENERDAFNSIEFIKTKQDKSGKFRDDTGKVLKKSMQDSRRTLRQPTEEFWTVQIYIKKYKWSHETDVNINSSEMKIAQALKEAIHRTIAVYRRNHGPLKPSFYSRRDKSGTNYKQPLMSILGNDKNHVFSAPNQFYNLHIKNKVKEIYVEKKPVKSNKYIGLELEFCAKIEEIPFTLELYNAGIHKYAQLKKDGSLRPHEGETGYELALLFPERHYKKYLRVVCNLLNKLGAVTLDRRCGLHVHIDMRNRNKDIVYNNLVACQDLLLGFVDPQRRDNEFCVSVKSRKFPTSFTNTREERYKTINAASYYKYKTLEIRMHQASTEFREIANWMDLLIKISNYPKKAKYDVKELTRFNKRFKINPKMRNFFQDKMCYWQVNNVRPNNNNGWGNRFTTTTGVIFTPVADDAPTTEAPTTMPGLRRHITLG